MQRRPGYIYRRIAEGYLPHKARDLLGRRARQQFTDLRKEAGGPPSTNLPARALFGVTRCRVLNAFNDAR